MFRKVRFEKDFLPDYFMHPWKRIFLTVLVVEPTLLVIICKFIRRERRFG